MGLTWIQASIGLEAPGSAVDDHRASRPGASRASLPGLPTGVATRVTFMDRLHRALARPKRGCGPVTVLLADLDRFEVINDVFGNSVGDALLEQIVTRLQPMLGSQVALTRWGDDEFAMLGTNLSRGRAATMAARIVESAHAPFVIGGEEITCTISVGISATSARHRDADGVVREASLALHAAKRRGRDRVEVFEEDLRRQAQGRVGIERMLRGDQVSGRSCSSARSRWGG